MSSPEEKNDISYPAVRALTAIFIDRDGVLNKDPGGWTEHSYVTDWKDFHFLPGALEALRLLKDQAIKVIVISNQAGVGKGYFSNEKLHEITSNMISVIEKHGGWIEEAYYCVHRSDENCSCRKPRTGLLEMASEKHGIVMGNTYFVGDSSADVEAGKGVGCQTVLVLSGKSSSSDIETWETKPDLVFKDLLGFVKWLIKKEGPRR